MVKIPKKYCWNEKCTLTKYLPISVDPDRCWLPYCAGAPVLPFLTCGKKKGYRSEGGEKTGKRSREKSGRKGRSKRWTQKIIFCRTEKKWHRGC